MGTPFRGALAVAAAVVAAAVCSPRPAASQPGEVFAATNAKQHVRTEDCTKPCQDKMRRLEHQVRSLQREVVQLRAEVDRLRSTDPGGAAAEVAESDVPTCDPPYLVDAKGIKRYRPECLEQAALAARAAECANPYFERVDGVKVFKPACLR